MRRCVGAALLVAASGSGASADDGTTIHVRRLEETQAGPLLHLDAMTLDRTNAEGGITDRQTVVLDLGPRLSLGAEGSSWQTGLAPSMFAEDLRFKGWRAGAELSYDVGPFSVGVNASIEHERDQFGDSTHRMVGLFAFRTFRLSRWMHAWIVFGIGFEQWDGNGVERPRQGLTTGLTLGTTFR